MAEPERIPGIDTIQGLVGTPPLISIIPHKIMRSATVIQQAWNASYIAFIPYCFKCKVPLDWHTPPDEGKVFTCPNCNRQWMLGEENDITKNGRKNS